MTREEMWKEFENQLISETRTPITMSYDDAKKLTKLGIEETVAKWKRRLEQTRWIPVSERLPEDHTNVLICLKSGQITIGLYNSHRLPFRDKPVGWGVDAQISVHNFCSDDVKAWMPLPQPYKGESEDAE